MISAMSNSGAWSTVEGAASWQASAAQREQAMAETTELLLSLAGVVPGARVLEIGAGTGDVALLAARRVGPSGAVLATDASAAMLEVAARLARDGGLTHVETLVVRAEELDLREGSFDAAISRNCFMFVRDLPRALRAVRQALRRGGRLATSVWGPAENNPYHGVPIAVVRRRGAIPTPPPEVVQAFTLSDGETLAAAMAEAGFADVRIQRANAARSFPSLEEAIRVAREFPTFVALLSGLADHEREVAWDEIRRKWARFTTSSALDLPGEQLVISGENRG
jgi:ubiquinone/menaquinone biosynthesis C-methylase UbiE